MIAWIERFRGHITLFLLLVMVIGGIVWWERRPAAQEVAITSPDETPRESARWLTVDVSGAVASPGIYSLREGSRVADAIAAAGGETADADLSRVNRAQRLRDELQVRVPRLAPTVPAGVAAAAAGPGANSSSNLIDLNTATKAQLDALPGVGAVISQRILDYRQRNGPFARIQELVEAKLVTPSAFEKIKDLITAQ